MNESGRTSRHALWGVALGILATLLILALYCGGVFERVELHMLDLRLKYAAPAPPMTDIVHIDIDDASLEQVGRWPWPRQDIAGLISTLDDAGADMVVLDIIFPEPQKRRFVHPASEVYSVDDSAVLQESPPQPVFDDALLREAISGTDVLYLPCHIAFVDKEVSEGQMPKRLRELLEAHPDWTLGRKEQKAKEYLAWRARQEVRRFAKDIRGKANAPRGVLVAPLVTLMQPADGSGYVTFSPDHDGVVRRMTLLGRTGGKEEFIFPQFALAVALGRLERRLGHPISLIAENGDLCLEADGEVIRHIPLVGEGESAKMLIAWTPGSWTDKAQDMSEGLHLSAGAVLGSWKLKQRLHGIVARRFLRAQQLLGLGKELPENPPEIKTLYYQVLSLTRWLNALYTQRLAAQQVAQRALLYDPQAGSDAEKAYLKLAEQERDVEKKLHQSAFKLVSLLREPATLPLLLGGSETLVTQAHAVLKEYDRLEELQNQTQKQYEESQADLYKRVAGKICLIGSTATGAADFVPTVLHKRTPGMVVHSNIIQTILSGHFISAAPMWVNYALIFLMGLAVSVLTARGSLIRSGIASLLLVIAFVVINVGLIFSVWRIWAVLIAPVLAAVLSLLVVAIYRQITEERAKRRIKGMFSHALSTELVDMVLEDPKMIAPQNRPITCLFSDLGGFTSLSGRLGPKMTVDLLHRYFDHVSDVVQTTHGGYLNKFLGDGVMAFYGAPVEQPDHPLRAVQASIDYLARVDQLNQELIKEFDLEKGIYVRIGVNTDEGMVGDCGSSQRMDYTAIGEVVNLASRLEAANKCFGTRLLVSKETWVQAQAAAEDLVARPLGRAIISGISQPVALWHVLGRGPELPAETLKAVDAHCKAMLALGERDFEKAIAAFDMVLDIWPEDFDASWWRERCRAVLDNLAEAEKPTPSIIKNGIVRLLWPWEMPDNSEFETPK